MLTTIRERRHSRRSAVGQVRRGLKIKMRLEGYTKEQADRLVGQIGDGEIWAKIKEFWGEWGPTILKIIMIFLPLLLAKEKPEGLKLASLKMEDIADLDAEYEAYVNEAPIDDGGAVAAGRPEGGPENPDDTAESGSGKRDLGKPCRFCGAKAGEPCRMQSGLGDSVRRLIDQMNAVADATAADPGTVGTMIRYRTADSGDVKVIGPFLSRWAADKAVCKLIGSVGGVVRDIVMCPATAADVASIVNQLNGA